MGSRDQNGLWETADDHGAWLAGDCCSFGVSGRGLTIGRIDAFHIGKGWRSKAEMATWAGGVFCTQLWCRGGGTHGVRAISTRKVC